MNDERGLSKSKVSMNCNVMDLKYKTESDTGGFKQAVSHLYWSSHIMLAGFLVISRIYHAITGSFWKATSCGGPWRNDGASVCAARCRSCGGRARACSAFSLPVQASIICTKGQQYVVPTLLSIYNTVKQVCGLSFHYVDCKQLAP